MTKKEFGRVIEEEPSETVEFGRIVEEEGPVAREAREVQEKFGRGGRALAKGGLKALGGILDLLVPKVDPERFPEEKFSFEEAVETLLPTDPEAPFLEKFAERGAEILPFLLGGEVGLGAKLGRAGLAALLGQTAEEVGVGPLGQTVAELSGLIAPGLGKKIIPTKAQREGVKMLRRRGLTEKEIAPLIPSERKRALLGKVGAKGIRTEKAARRTRTALGNVYEQLRTEGERLPFLEAEANLTLGNAIEDKLEKIPASIRKVIQEDLKDLLNKPIKANDIINFWEDINSSINWKSVADGKRKLNSLKKPLLDSLKKINPTLARDFELTNKFYSQMKKVYPNLRPTDIDKWIALGELGSLVGGLFKFGPKAAVPVLGFAASRKLASAMLTNPRLQNLTRQMTKALKQNKIGIAKKINDKIQKELQKEKIKVKE